MIEKLNCEEDDTAIVTWQRDGYPCEGFMGAIVVVRRLILVLGSGRKSGWHWVIEGDKVCRLGACVCNSLPDFCLKPLRGGSLGEDDPLPTTGEAKDLPAPQVQVDPSGGKWADAGTVRSWSKV